MIHIFEWNHSYWSKIKGYKKILHPTWKCHFHVLMRSLLRHSWFCIVFENHGFFRIRFHFNFRVLSILITRKYKMFNYLTILLSRDMSIGYHVIYDVIILLVLVIMHELGKCLYTFIYRTLILRQLLIGNYIKQNCYPKHL